MWSGSDYGLSMAVGIGPAQTGHSKSMTERAVEQSEPRNLFAVAALCIVVVTWLAIPFLWATNEWGEFSQAEVLWLAALALAVVLGAGGLLTIRTRGETALAVTVFFASLVLPTVAGLYLWLVRALFGSVGFD
jgi:hypothetical protein